MRISIYLLSFLIFIAACKKEDPGPLHYFVLPADSDCAPVLLDSFPLTQGHVWIYDSGDTMRTLADTIINGSKTTKLCIGQGANLVNYHLKNASDGFWNLAFPLDSATPRNAGLSAYLYDMNSVGNSLNAVPIRLMKFPIVLNDTFSSGENYFGEYYQSQWITFKRITTVAGTFDCAVLKVQSSGAQSWYRYYSTKGLVREISVVTFGSKAKDDPGFYYSTTDLISINF
ncbi:hypothetical protein [Taibaiella soli]|uniref:Uncharacterized protein n=1 Tax=Taibaiella soli TaxID=1649169 RepID=A0A2W2AIB5_9BACT|nr:hypothetical protein [Taibaiella soli]PZF75021.1 hypothetical protein DN068_00260 [Taibaiella soli]